MLTSVRPSRSLAAFVLVAATFTAPALAQQFDDCGTLESGVTCPLLFRADTSGGLYLIDDPLTGYAVGDRLRVMGMLDTGCFTICGQGDGCIFTPILSTCSATSIGVPFCLPGTPNSTGTAGVAEAFGSATIQDDDVTIIASELPPTSFGYFVCSLTQSAGTIPPGSQGMLCLGGNVGRFDAQVGQVDGMGTYAISTDPAAGAQQFSLAAVPQPTGPIAVMPGDTWSFQCWHRDANPMATSNFTEGVQITFQ